MSNLDKIDRKILNVLIRNSRTPISKIAKECLISKQRCHFRIKRLEEDNIIQEYKTKIDTSKLGFNTYGIYLKIVHLSKTDEEKIINLIKNNKRVRWLVTAAGRWNFIVAVSSKNNLEFNQILKEILKSFENNIIEYETTIILSTQDMWMKQLEEIKALDEVGKKEEYYLDDFDKKILYFLSNNSRIESTEISKHIPLTAEAISHRIKKLYKDNIIHSFTISINKEKLGMTWYQVQFLLKNITAKDEKNIISKISSIDGINYIVYMIGKWNFEINMYCKNITEFKENIRKITELLANHIKEYHINIILERHKSTTYIL